MAIISRYIPLVWALVIGIGLQGWFICSDKNDMPNMAAVEFSKAYFKLDRCTMDKYICGSLKSSDAIGNYMNYVSSSASARGYKPSYLKSSLAHIRTHVKERSETQAVVTLTAKKRKSINPAFEAVGVIFGLIDTTDVSRDINLVKENGEWKVCGDILHLS